MSKKKILLTGSGGFIFSNFTRYAIHNNAPYNLVSIDKVKKSSVLQNIYNNKNHTFHIGDVSDAHFINVIFESERPDIVLHTAAESSVDSSIEDASPFITSNVMGTQVIIDACVRWGVERLVFSSTDEIYGHLTDGDAPAWTEDALLNPRNPYSASKAAGELLIKAAHETHGLNYQITRCCNNYGPRQDSEKFMPKVIGNILNNEKVPVYGEGKQIRDWLFVNDNCEAVLTILEKGKLNEVYNISANKELTNIDMFHKICDTLGKGHDLIEFVKDRPGHDFRYSVDSSKIRELGWKPKNELSDDLTKTAQWYVNNQWWFKR